MSLKPLLILTNLNPAPRGTLESRKCKSQTELDRMSGGQARSPKHDSVPLIAAIRGHVPPLIPSHTE